MKSYKEGTSLKQIIEDGWARGFHQSQTYEEATAQGFHTTEDYIILKWSMLEEEWIDYYRQDKIQNPEDYTQIDITGGV